MNERILRYKCTNCKKPYKVAVFCSVKMCACEDDKTQFMPNVNRAWFKERQTIKEEQK